MGLKTLDALLFLLLAEDDEGATVLVKSKTHFVKLNLILQFDPSFEFAINPMTGTQPTELASAPRYSAI